MSEHEHEHEHDAEAWNRHREKQKPRRIKIAGRSLLDWGRRLLMQDLKNIRAAVTNGVLAGDDNTTIAHRVIGTRALNGRNGATELTRQQLIRLGREYVRKLKRGSNGRTRNT